MNKRVLQAFSAGIFTSTTILTLTFYLGGYHKPAVVKEKVTQTDVESYLADNEQVAISKQEYKEYQQLKDDAKEQNMTKQKEEDKKPKQDEKPVEEAKPKLISITIKEGMATSEVSKLLESAGIIESSSEFTKYLIEHDYHTRVQIGTFEVREDMSFYELAEAITR